MIDSSKIECNCNCDIQIVERGVLMEIIKTSNLTSAAVQVEANLQEELSVHLHFRKLKCF